MKLLLHIGLNKTGSSFIQSCFAQNRELLEKNNIFFPIDSKQEDKMISDKISPGNGQELYMNLINEDYKSAREILVLQIKKAKNIGCNSLLISNERLFAVFSNKSILIKFVQICNDIGICKFDYLLIIRDPVPHLLSLYKHRAKEGMHRNFEEWMKTDYETVSLLSKLIGSFKNKSIKWNIRKYDSDGYKMLELTFKEWLKIDMPKIDSNKRVNCSLNISELILIQNIRKYDPFLVKYVYQEFIKINKIDKADDIELENGLIEKAKLFLNDYSAFYLRLNEYLPTSEKLDIDFRNSLANYEKNIVLSEFQIESLSKAIKESNKLKNILKKRVLKSIKYFNIK